MKVSLYKYTFWECQRCWRGGCANSSSRLCPSHSQIFPEDTLHLLGNGKLLAAVRLLRDGDKPGESPRKQSQCWVSCTNSSLSLFPQGCASQPGNGHQPPSTKPRFITGLPAGCFMFYNVCSLLLSISMHSFCAQRESSPCLLGAAG